MDVEERLQRMKAFDRMKELSDQFLQAKKRGDNEALARIAAERQSLKREFFGVVK